MLKKLPNRHVYDDGDKRGKLPKKMYMLMSGY